LSAQDAVPKVRVAVMQISAWKYLNTEIGYLYGAATWLWQASLCSPAPIGQKLQ